MQDQLNDKEIRAALMDWLAKKSPKPRAILEELRVINGNAIADVVSVHATAHCYEIKGARDKTQRAAVQAEFYDQAFSKTTLVTTENHLRNAATIAPTHWGILVARQDAQGQIKFKHHRGAKQNPNYDKSLALLTLWRAELIFASQELPENKTKLSRQKLCELIAKISTKDATDKLIGQILTERHTKTKKG